MAREVQENPGISTKEFNAALDRYLTDGTGETAVYVRMNPKQQYVFKETNKALKRLLKNNDYGEGGN